MPATDREILQFSSKLDNICMRSTEGDGYHEEIVQDSGVTLGDKSIQSVKFRAYYTYDHDAYRVTWSHAVPMANIWQPVKSDGTAVTEKDENPELKPGNLQEYNREIDTDIEGYLVTARELTVTRHTYCRPIFALAEIKLGLDLVDNEFRTIESYFGYHSGIRVDGTSQSPDSIKRLVDSGEPILDIDETEDIHTVVTRADLIVAASMLRQRGIMNHGTLAYSGAPLTIDDYTGLVYIDDADD